MPKKLSNKKQYIKSKIKKNKKDKNMKIREINENSIFIKNWEELKNVSHISETHELEIDLIYSRGWIHEKGTDGYNHYLSTHTFYKGYYTYYTDLLRECGFNVTLDNWDKTH